MRRYALRKRIIWLLITMMIMSPSLALAQQPAMDGATRARKAALRLIPKDANLAVIALPSKTMKAPSLDMLPTEVFSAMGRENLGIDPADIDIAVLAGNVQPNSIPSAALALRLNKELDPDSVPMDFTGERQVDEINGKPYWRTASGLNFYFANAKTIFIGFDSMIRQMISKENGDSNLKRHLAAGKATNIQAILMLEAVRPMLNAELSRAPQLPGNLEVLKSIPDETESVEIRIAAGKTLAGSIAIHANDEVAAKSISAIIEDALKTGQEMILRDMATGGDDQVSIAMNQYTRRMAKRSMDMVRPSVKGSTLVLGGKTNSEGQIVIIGTLAALLLPAVQSARTAAVRVTAMNSLKQISLAFFNYESAYGRFPAQAICDDDGKPLLSWRVAILPFIEQQELYEQFHLDEPWDSEHNKELIPLIPDVYVSNGQPNDGKTHFLGLVGEDLFFSGKHGEEGRRLRDFTDGTSKSLTVLESDQTVEWTKPEDLKVDFDNPKKNLGKLRKKIFNAALGDGSVRAISNEIDSEVLKAIFTINGGEVANF